MVSGMYSKTSMDGGGGGSGGGGSSSYKIKRPSALERMYQANQVLSLDHKNKFHILKNRSGKHGELDITGAVDFVADMLTKHIFDGSMDMFQETMKMKLVECMSEIVSGKNIVPKGDIENANTVQRESRGDGSGRNSLLQGFISLCR